MPYKDQNSEAAIASRQRTSRTYEANHREKRREEKRTAYWSDPDAERERNRDLKKRWRVEGKCVNCGSLNDLLPKTLCSGCAPKIAAATKKWHLRLRREAFNAYGGPQCKCCGILIDDFLTIDHINGGGNRQKEELGGGGVKLYAWLKREGYPPGFQVLCMNCNFAKGKYGQCPHERGV